MYSFQMLENAWYCTEEILEKNSLGIIVDGITDFNIFLNQFKIVNNEMIIHQLSKTSLFLLFKSNFQDFKLLKKDFDYSHYHLYSIFLKEKYFDKFSKYFKQDKSKIPSFKKELYYLFFESNNYTSNYIKIQNQSDFKILTKSPPRYFYGFDTYKDLLAAYVLLVEEGKNWPIFALPTKFIEKVQNHNFFNDQDGIKENNILLYHKYQSKFPLFCPDEKLFYLSFIEKEIKNFQRIQNQEEMYSIQKIDDIQISHIYKESIRTFLGFKNLFRCLHVFDFFLHFEKDKKKIFDVELIENSFNNLNRVRYDLFYIEIQNDKLQSPLFDSSILYTLNYIDLCELNSSYFYGFDNQTDFEEALKIFSDSKKIVIDDIRIVDRNEFNSLFDKKITSKIVKTQFFYIIFSMQKGEIIELKTLLKTAKIIEKNVNVKNIKYFLIGFATNDDREKVYNSLKKFQQSNEIRCFRPEKEKSAKKKQKKKSIQNSEQIENYIEKADEEKVDQIESNEYDSESYEQSSQLIQTALNQNENQRKNEEDDKNNHIQNDQIEINLISEKLNNNNQISEEPKKTTEDKTPKNLGSDYFSPNQNLIYLYFIEKEKARKISQGKQAKLTLFGVKKCKDIQRYKKLNSNEENGYFTFFGFEKYEETVTAVNDIKSKWLSETAIKIYEGTNAFIKHQNEPNSLYNSEDEQLFMRAIKNKKQQNQQPNINSIKDKNININNVRINCYKSFKVDQISSFFYFDQISVPNNIQLEIKNILSKSRIVKNIIKDVILASYIESPCTVILLDGYDPLVDMLYKTAFAHHKIGYSLIDYETYNHFHYIEINEHLIEKKILEKMIVFLSKTDEVEKIERSIFHHGLIVTLIFFDFSNSFYVTKLIEHFLSNENMLFDYMKYPMKKTIFFNEEIALKKKEDFDLILNEIENFGIHPINVERNKLLFTEIPYVNKCIQKFSFICFKSKEEKLRALNHINSIVLKDIKDVNIVKFNPSLFYMKIDPFKYSLDPNKNIWALLEKTVKDLIDIGDFQMKVRSIESPIELGYIGFKSKRYLLFYHQLVLVRLTNFTTNSDINFFNPNYRLFYLQYQTKNGVDLVRCLKSEFIDKIKDYQPNCLKLDECNHQIFSYIGFETEQERGFAFFQLTSVIRNPNIVNVMLLGIEFKDEDLKGSEELVSENLITLINS